MNLAGVAVVQEGALTVFGLAEPAVIHGIRDAELCTVVPNAIRGVFVDEPDLDSLAAASTAGAMMSQVSHERRLTEGGRAQRRPENIWRIHSVTKTDAPFGPRRGNGSQGSHTGDFMSGTTAWVG
jgi:hypothetical protein